MRYTGPKTRQCRQEGINLFSSPKYQKILSRRPGIPGMHGSKRRGKMTEYAKQLREKQKTKRIFGLSEKQFKRYFIRADRSSGVTGDKLLEYLERRLDNVVFRAGFAVTRMQARQFVSHGLFTLNGRKVDIPSIMVRPGDRIEVKTAKKKLVVFSKNREEMKDYLCPDWLKSNMKTLEIEVVSIPEPKHFEQMVNTQLIVEFYSR